MWCLVWRGWRSRGKGWLLGLDEGLDGEVFRGVEVPEDEELIEDEKEGRRRGGLRPLQGTKEV